MKTGSRSNKLLQSNFHAQLSFSRNVFQSASSQSNCIYVFKENWPQTFV